MSIKGIHHLVPPRAKKLGHISTSFLLPWAKGCSSAVAKDARARENPEAQSA